MEELIKSKLKEIEEKENIKIFAHKIRCQISMFLFVYNAQ